MLTPQEAEEIRERPGFIPVHQYGRAIPAPWDGEIGCIGGRRYVVRG